MRRYCIFILLFSSLYIFSQDYISEEKYKREKELIEANIIKMKSRLDRLDSSVVVNKSIYHSFLSESENLKIYALQGDTLLLKKNIVSDFFNFPSIKAKDSQVEIISFYSKKDNKNLVFKNEQILREYFPFNYYIFGLFLFYLFFFFNFTIMKVTEDNKIMLHIARFGLIFVILFMLYKTNIEITFLCLAIGLIINILLRKKYTKLLSKKP